MIPKHLNPVPDHNRAIAPYNFVELPDLIVPAEAPPKYDRYYCSTSIDNSDIKRYTGKIVCTLTTSSPLYIRSGLIPNDFAEFAEKTNDELTPEQRNKRAAFYNNPANHLHPTIPGSSLRGMLRTLVEIISYSKIDRVTENRLFYRSLGDPALKPIYTANFIQNENNIRIGSDPVAPGFRAKIRTGFLRKRGNNYIIEECDYGRIERQQIPRFPNQQLYIDRIPNWRYQNKIIYVTLGEDKYHFFPRNQRHPDFYLGYRAVEAASFTTKSSMQPATLVMNGDMPNKHLEFVFLHEIIGEHQVPNGIVQRFQDEDQITQWQEAAFPKDKPSPNCRSRNGYLRDGEPLFFLLDKDNKVSFIGRCQMFRLPYEYSPYDLIPSKLRDPNIVDLAEAIFGFVRTEKREEDQLRAGRIFISDAICQETTDIWLTGDVNKTVTPHILGSPKPTTFQHYLVQTNTAKPELKHYGKSGVVIRGHKLYWHKGKVEQKQIEEVNPQENAVKSQYTTIKPIKENISFDFCIYFENLSEVELGALHWILDIAANDKYRLSLGMGKPLGMGAVNITTNEFCLSDRTERYTHLLQNKNWRTGEIKASGEQIKPHIQAFERYVLEVVNKANRTNYQHLKDVPRIQTLLTMLSWHCPSSRLTRYMEIERATDLPHIGNANGKKKVNEYKERPVLPTPLQVMQDDRNKNYPDGGGGGSNSLAFQKPTPPRNAGRSDGNSGTRPKPRRPNSQ